jgi:peptide/nickel transport system ATP-binding protein
MASAGGTHDSILMVTDLTVSFHTDDGPVLALDGVSFAVERGRTLGVVGESGCGKSVTARAVLRIEDRNADIQSGRILLHRDNEDVDLAALDPGSQQMRAIRGGAIALIFQEPMTSFSPVHTIGNQLIEAILLHCDVSRREAHERALEQLRAVGTPHPGYLMTRYAWELSGGLRQRAMIAMALACDPQLLIADEPTTALDVTTQAQVLALMRSLQRERNMAMILITHDLGVIAESADDVMVMYLGKAVEQGSAASVLSAPRHPYTRALLRSMPDVTARPRERLPTLRGAVPHPLNRPRGCPFHPRCSDAIPGKCDQLAPGPTKIDDTIIRCFIYGDAVEVRAHSVSA